MILSASLLLSVAVSGKEALNAFVSRIAVTTPRVHLAIVLFAGLVFTAPGLTTLPPLDRDEARFAQATVQMLETGDFLRIRFQDAERNKKPGGIYWLQAASVSAFSSPSDRAIWAYRLPSMAGIIMAMVGIWMFGNRFLTSTVGLSAALLFGASPVAMGEATIAKTDAMLTGLVVMMMLGFAASLDPKSPQNGTVKSPVIWPLLFWLSMAAGILVKGPIAPMIAALSVFTIAIFRRFSVPNVTPPIKLMGLRPLLGLIILSAVTVPWALAINGATDGRFFADAIGGDFLGKVTGVQESHAGPPGYHLALLAILFWPIAALLPGLVGTAFANRGGVVQLAVWRWCLLGWLIPAWVVFELSGTKLPHYTLPLLPAFALLAAHWLASSSVSSLPRLTLVIGSLLSLAIGIGFAVAMPVLQFLYATGGISVWALGLSILIVTMSLAGAILIWRGACQPGTMLIAATSFVSGFSLLSLTLPSLDRFAVSPALAAQVTAQGHKPGTAEDTPPVCILGYREPSAVFLLGTKTVLATDIETVTVALSADHCTIAIVEENYKQKFLKLAQMEKLSLYQVASVNGFNYSKGDPVTLTIFQTKSPQKSSLKTAPL